MMWKSTSITDRLHRQLTYLTGDIHEEQETTADTSEANFAEEFLEPLGLSQNELARMIKVSPRAINEIVLHRRGITGNMAQRLARYFGTTPRYWMNMQTGYELEVAEDKFEAEISEINPISEAKEKMREPSFL